MDFKHKALVSVGNYGKNDWLHLKYITEQNFSLGNDYFVTNTSTLHVNTSTKFNKTDFRVFTGLLTGITIAGAVEKHTIMKCH